MGSFAGLSIRYRSAATHGKCYFGKSYRLGRAQVPNDSCDHVIPNGAKRSEESAPRPGTARDGFLLLAAFGAGMTGSRPADAMSLQRRAVEAEFTGKTAAVVIGYGRDAGRDGGDQTRWQ